MLHDLFDWSPYSFHRGVYGGCLSHRAVCCATYCRHHSNARLVFHGQSHRFWEGRAGCLSIGDLPLLYTVYRNIGVFGTSPF